jgi:hypothetical protein
MTMGPSRRRQRQRPRSRRDAAALLASAAVVVVVAAAAVVVAAASASAPAAAAAPTTHQLPYYDEDELAASLEASGGLAGRGTGDLFTFVGAAAHAAAGGGAAAAAGAGASSAAAAAAAAASSSSSSPLGKPLTPAKVLWPWADGTILRTRLKVLNATLPASLKPALKDYFSRLPGKMCAAASASAAALAALPPSPLNHQGEKTSSSSSGKTVGPPPLPKLVPDLISDNLCPYKVMQMPLNGIVGPSTWGVVAMEWAGGPYFAMQRALDFCEILYAPELACDRELAARLAAVGGGGRPPTKSAGVAGGAAAASTPAAKPPNPRSTPLRLCSLLATPEFPGGREGCKDPWADADPTLYWKYVQRKLADRFPGLGAVAKKLPPVGGGVWARAAGRGAGAATAQGGSDALRKLPQAIRAAPDFLFDDLKALWATPAAMDAAVAAANSGASGGGSGGGGGAAASSAGPGGNLWPDGPLGVLLCPPSPVRHASGAGYPNVGPLVSIARLMWRMDAPQAAIAALADDEAEAAAANRALCSAITQRLAKDVATVALYPAKGMGAECVAASGAAGPAAGNPPSSSLAAGPSSPLLPGGQRDLTGGDPAACAPAGTTVPRPASPDSARGRVAAAAALSITVDGKSLRRTRVQRWAVGQQQQQQQQSRLPSSSSAPPSSNSATVEGGGAPAAFSVALSRDGPESLVRTLRGTFTLRNRDTVLPISATKFIAEVTDSGPGARAAALAAPMAPLGGSRAVEGASATTTTYHDLSLSTSCGIYRPLAPGKSVTCPYELVLPPGAPDRAAVRLLAVVAPATAADLAAAAALEPGPNDAASSSSSSSGTSPSAPGAAPAAAGDQEAEEQKEDAADNAEEDDQDDDQEQRLLRQQQRDAELAAEVARPAPLGGGEAAAAAAAVGSMLAAAKSPQAIASKAQDALRAAGVKLQDAQIKARVLKRGGFGGGAPQLARQGGTWVLGDGSSEAWKMLEEGAADGGDAKKASKGAIAAGLSSLKRGRDRGAERDELASSAAARRAAAEEAAPATYDFAGVPAEAAGVCAHLRLEGVGEGGGSSSSSLSSLSSSLTPRRVALRALRPLGGGGNGGSSLAPADALAVLAANLTSPQGLRLCQPAVVSYSLAYDAPAGALKKGGGADGTSGSGGCDPSRPARAPLQQVFEASHTVSVAPDRAGMASPSSSDNAAPTTTAITTRGKTLAEAMAALAAADRSAGGEDDAAVGLLPKAYSAGPFLVRVIVTPPPPCASGASSSAAGGAPDDDDGGSGAAGAATAAAAATGTRAAMLAASLQNLRAVPQAPRLTLKHGVALPARKNQAALIATTPWAVSRGLKEAAQRAADAEAERAEAAAAAGATAGGDGDDGEQARGRVLLQMPGAGGGLPSSLQGLAQGLVSGGGARAAAAGGLLAPPSPSSPSPPTRRSPPADVRRSPAAAAVLSAPQPTALVRVTKQRLVDTLNLRSAVMGGLGGGPVFVRLDVTVGAAAAAPQGGTFTLLGQPAVKVRASNPRIAAAAPGNVWRVRGANVSVFATEEDAAARRASAVVPARFAVGLGVAAPSVRGVAAASASASSSSSSSSSSALRPQLLIPPYIDEATGQSLAEVIVWGGGGGGGGGTDGRGGGADGGEPRPLPRFAQLTVSVDRLTDERVTSEVRAAAERDGFPSPDAVWRLLGGGGNKGISGGGNASVLATPPATVEGPVQPLLPYTPDELAAVAASGGAEAPCLTLHAPAPFVRVLSAEDDAAPQGAIDAAARAVVGVATPGGRRRRAAMRSGTTPAVKLVNPALEAGAGAGGNMGGMAALAPIFGWTNRTAAKAAALAEKQRRALALASEAVSSVPLEVASALISQSGVDGVGGKAALPGMSGSMADAAAAAPQGATAQQAGGAGGGGSSGGGGGPTGLAEAPDGFADPDPVARSLAESGTAVVCPKAGAPPLAWTMPYRIGPFERCGVYDVVVSAFGAPGAKASAAAVAPSERVVRVVVDGCGT